MTIGSLNWSLHSDRQWTSTYINQSDDPQKCKENYRLYQLGHLADCPSIYCGDATNQVTTINNPQGHLTDHPTNLTGILNQLGYHHHLSAGSLIWPPDHPHWTLNQSGYQHSSPSLSPAMHVGEMTVEILHLGEHMACRRTPSDPAIEMSLMIRVIHTNWPVFQHTFFDPVHLTTVREPKTLVQLRGVNIMLALWCCFIPWELAYCLLQSGHATLWPWTQAEVCLLHIFLLANTLPHLSHGYFSP